MKKKEKEEKLHIQNQVATSLQSFQVFFHLHTISHGLYLPLYLPLSLSLSLSLYTHQFSLFRTYTLLILRLLRRNKWQVRDYKWEINTARG